MTHSELERVKAQLLQGEESLRKHYDFSDISTLVGLLNTCISIMQSSEEWIEIMEVNNKSIKAELETEKKLRQIVMQDLSEQTRELFKAELSYKLYRAKKEGQVL